MLEAKGIITWLPLAPVRRQWGRILKEIHTPVIPRCVFVYISNEERNTLYQNCHTFLFPSVFEGFGMPTVEAMYFGARVVTTQCACIPEVTQGKAVYVQDPYDAEEWIRKIEMKTKQEEPDFGRYAPEHIARLYLEALKEDEWKKR